MENKHSNPIHCPECNKIVLPSFDFAGDAQIDIKCPYADCGAKLRVTARMEVRVGVVVRE